MKNIFLTALSALAFHSFAQVPPKEPVDAKAKGILDKLSAKTKTYTSIKAEFSSVMTKGAKTMETIGGSLITKAGKYKLDFKGQTIICDGKTQWTIIKEQKEVQITDAPDDKSTETITPLNIFTLYEKGFKFKYEKEETVNGSSCDVIDLFPLQSDKKAYHTVKLYIDKAKLQIVMAKILFKKDQSVNTISLKSFAPNSEIPDATFTYKKADCCVGYTEIDLRDEK
jgi:outer membrane lipoprotein-sorting protein